MIMVGKTAEVLHRTMDVELLRQNVIAHNIANSDTPNFKRSTVSFESELGRALAGENAPQFAAHRTHSAHVPFRSVRTYQDVRPVRQVDYATTAKNNGNNVDIEAESSNLLRSRLAYSLYTNSVSQIYNRVGIVLR